MLTVAVGNSQSRARTEELVNRIVTALENGDEVRVRNDVEHTGSTIAAIEAAKQRLVAKSYTVHQRNTLAYTRQYAEVGDDPVAQALVKPKVHHYALNFESVLRASPK